MPVQIGGFVGGSTVGVSLEGDRTKLPTETTDPSTAEAGDLYLSLIHISEPTRPY